MSLSPNSELLRRTIDQNYADKKRSSSLKWIAVNGIFFLLFSADLWGACAGYTSPLHYVELCCAGVAAANLLHHALRLARRRPRAPPPRRLDLDSSQLESSPTQLDTSAEALAPGGARAWRQPAASPAPSPAAPVEPLGRHERDEFIADRRDLANYLRQQMERSASAEAWGAEAWGAGAGGAPLYQLAAAEAEGAGEEPGAAAAPQVWRRLQLDPQRLTQFNLNLRLWIHVTILERVVREMDALDAALAALGLDVRIGQVSTERLRKLAASGLPALNALLPFLEPFPDQRYVAQRYRELAQGGCLSEYKWNGGGAEWDASRPSDAELVLHAFAAYLDAALPGEGARGAFSARHVSAAPAAPPRGPGALAVHRVSRAPPHYVLVRGDETVELGAGRSNLLHCLLVLVAQCAAREPPALRRLHLGPAGLNMLWILGR